MTQELPQSTPFDLRSQHGKFITLTLPAQTPMNRNDYDPVLPPTEVLLFRRGSDQGALDNALSLLETLYTYGITSPHVLRVILTATGHTQTVTPAHPEAAKSEGAT